MRGLCPTVGRGQRLHDDLDNTFTTLEISTQFSSLEGHIDRLSFMAEITKSYENSVVAGPM